MEGLNNKVAIITGGSSGIGKATALAFARENTKVAILSIQPEEGAQVVDEIKGMGGDAIFINTDVTRSDEVKKAVDTVFDTWGRLDFAVNNAGINGEVAKIIDYAEEDWDNIININLKGVWLSMKYEIPKMLETGGGAIVNIASICSSVSSLKPPIHLPFMLICGTVRALLLTSIISRRALLSLSTRASSKGICHFLSNNLVLSQIGQVLVL